MHKRLHTSPCVWASAMLLALAIGASAGGQAGDECSIPRSIAVVRPDDDGPPTPVKIGLFVVDVVKIDEATESFTADFTLTVRWKDPRLSAAALGASLEDCVLELHEVWHPGLGMINQRRLWPRAKDYVRVDDEGNVEYVQRWFGEVTSTFHLQDFPFDEQLLEFRFVSEYGPDEVELQGDPDTTGRLPDAALAGWMLVDVEDAPHTEPLQALGRAWTVSEFTLRAERMVGFYVWKVFVPLSLIVAMASIVFWIDPQNLGPQLGVSTASVFTLVAFLISMGRLLPRISYLTAADLFVYGSVMLVFAALAESVVTSQLTQRGRTTAALRIDRHARWIYWTIFGLIVVVLKGF